MQKMKLLKYFVLFAILFCYAQSHLLPEDSMTDDAEQLIREKRDNFFDRILKTIPFFNISPSQPSEQETDIDDVDEDDADRQFHPDISEQSMFILEPSAPMHFLEPSSIVNNATILPTISSTVLLSNSSILNATVVASGETVIKTPVLISSTLSPSSTIIQTSAMGVSLIAPSKTIVQSSEQSSTISTIAAEMHTSLAYATAAATISSSVLPVKPTPSASVSENTVSRMDLAEPLFKMMIMTGNDNFAPKLPNEEGYGGSLSAKSPENGEESEVKGTRFFYTNVLLPVISGLFGALFITFGILLFKCARRRKLQKIRYYGGKPDSTLYGLDHLGLLSDMSSDEED